MTNKRMHQLERKVRINFSNFNQIVYPLYVEIKFLEQITKLVFDSIWFLHYRGNITINEARFMRQCARRYYMYYKTLIDKNYD